MADAKMGAYYARNPTAMGAPGTYTAMEGRRLQNGQWTGAATSATSAETGGTNWMKGANLITPPNLNIPTLQQALPQGTYNTLTTPTQVQQLGQLGPMQQLGQLSWNNPLVQQIQQQQQGIIGQEQQAMTQQMQRAWEPQYEQERERVAQRGLIGAGVENELLRRLQAEQSGSLADALAQISIEGQKRAAEMGLQGLGMASERDIANQGAQMQYMGMQSEREIQNVANLLQAQGMDKDSAIALAQMTMESEYKKADIDAKLYEIEQNARLQDEQLGIDWKNAETEEEKGAILLYQTNAESLRAELIEGHISQQDYDFEMQQLNDWYFGDRSQGYGMTPAGDGTASGGVAQGGGYTSDRISPDADQERVGRLLQYANPSREATPPDDYAFMRSRGYDIVGGGGRSRWAYVGGQRY